MVTNFITTEVDFQENTKKLLLAIELELKKYGEPLRWAITSIDKKNQTIRIEAVITND
jgi:hypothetical protein